MPLSLLCSLLLLLKAAESCHCGVDADCLVVPASAAAARCRAAAAARHRSTAIAVCRRADLNLVLLVAARVDGVEI